MCAEGEIFASPMTTQNMCLDANTRDLDFICSKALDPVLFCSIPQVCSFNLQKI
jgi:hypothetical protein